jgi:hypothetical protein
VSVRHQAPRREVIDIVRSGGYGTTRYHHRLACGHTEIRRRPAPATTLGCERCALDVLVERRTSEALAALPPTEAVSLVSVEASVEVDAARLRAGLAALLKVDLDDVVMHTTTTSITGASVWISAAALNVIRDRLLGPSDLRKDVLPR